MKPAEVCSGPCEKGGTGGGPLRGGGGEVMGRLEYHVLMMVSNKSSWEYLRVS